MMKKALKMIDIELRVMELRMTDWWKIMQMNLKLNRE